MVCTMKALFYVTYFFKLLRREERGTLTPLEQKELVYLARVVGNVSLIQNWPSYKLKYPSLLLFIPSLFNTIVFSSDDYRRLFEKDSMKTRLRFDVGTLKAISMYDQWNSGWVHVYRLLIHDGPESKVDLFC